MTLTTADKIKGVGLFSAILLVASNTAFAVTPVGPGEYRIDTADCAVSLIMGVLYLAVWMVVCKMD